MPPAGTKGELALIFFNVAKKKINNRFSIFTYIFFYREYSGKTSDLHVTKQQEA